MAAFAVWFTVVLVGCMEAFAVVHCMLCLHGAGVKGAGVFFQAQGTAHVSAQIKGACFVVSSTWAAGCLEYCVLLACASPGKYAR